MPEPATLASQTVHYKLKRYAFSGLCIAFASALFAQGDTCTTAFAVTGTGTYYADGPSTGDGSTTVCGASSSNGDWYVYTPTFTGTVEISSCDSLNLTFGTFSGVDTYVSVSTGGCGALTCVGWNDDIGGGACNFGNGIFYGFSSGLSFDVVAGESYYIVWHDVFSQSPFYWRLTECFGSARGVTYIDQDNDGTRDSSEVISPVMLSVEPGGVNLWSNGDPYTFCTDSGSFTIGVPTPPLYHTVSPASHSYSVNAPGQLITGLDFAFAPEPGHHDGRASIWGWNPWIGNNTSYQIDYRNVGTENLDGTVELTLDALTTFVSSDPAPSSIAGQTVSWSVLGMTPSENGHIHVIYHTDSSALTTDLVVASVSFNVDQTEETPGDNTDVISAHPTTSFDPNDKAVNSAQITLDEIAMGKALEYTVRFQNTGDMPAVNIVLRDVIDSDLDLSTFEMVGTTHANTVSINGNELVWTFAGIMLPSSDNDYEGSQGAVHFRIRPKSASLPGTLLENSAAIYFDYNAPVITNTVTTEVASPESVLELAKANGFTLYPNPGNGDMRLLWASTSVTNARIDVIDATGRVLLSRNAQRLIEGQSMPFDLGTLSDGNYLVRVGNERINLTNMVTVRR